LIDRKRSGSGRGRRSSGGSQSEAKIRSSGEVIGSVKKYMVHEIGENLVREERMKLSVALNSALARWVGEYRLLEGGTLTVLVHWLTRSRANCMPFPMTIGDECNVLLSSLGGSESEAQNLEVLCVQHAVPFVDMCVDVLCSLEHHPEVGILKSRDVSCGD
jgi:hypothetical protein